MIQIVWNMCKQSFIPIRKQGSSLKLSLIGRSSAYVCLICSAKCHHFITSGIFLVNDMQTSPPPPSKRAVLIFWYKLLRIFWNKFKTKKKYSDFFFSYDQFCSQFWSIRNQYSGFWVLSQLTKSRPPPLPFSFDPTFMTDAQCAETNEKIILRFLQY